MRPTAHAMFILRANVNRRTSRYAHILRAIEQKEDLYGLSSPLQHDTALPRSGTPCPDSAIVVDNVAANMIRKRVRHHLQTANFIVYSAEMSFICEPLLFYINIVSIALQMVE